MRERFEPTLKIVCLALAAILFYQCSILVLRKQPLAHLTIPALPTLSTNTAAQTGGKETNSVVPQEPAKNETNSIASKPTGTNLTNAASAQEPGKPLTNSVPLQGPPKGAGNMAVMRPGPRMRGPNAGPPPGMMGN